MATSTTSTMWACLDAATLTHPATLASAVADAAPTTAKKSDKSADRGVFSRLVLTCNKSDAPLPQNVIIFAVDGSQASLKAMQFGFDNLVNPNMHHIVLLGVGAIEEELADVFVDAMDKLLGPAASTKPTDADSLSRFTSTDEILRSPCLQTHPHLRAALEDAMESLSKAEPLVAGTSYSYELAAVASEEPRQSIIDFAEAWADKVKANRQDLEIESRPGNHHGVTLVAGSRGMGTLGRLVMGSVSDYLVHHASKCDAVVIVK